MLKSIRRVSETNLNRKFSNALNKIISGSILANPDLPSEKTNRTVVWGPKRRGGAITLLKNYVRIIMYTYLKFFDMWRRGRCGAHTSLVVWDPNISGSGPAMSNVYFDNRRRGGD
ncbi:hypothetical protein Bpfe_012320 [Biomphalaria pfeifferi]|uniref:Uncharacterized protein n=1 Tax=Biomphalaria pfeifferi TaxID=112525 RepID=A0AAD8BPA9_BIOPF|nr:hypothetical protein Bpfe_012320 [Biomphalaria pfeifferi]